MLRGELKWSFVRLGFSVFFTVLFDLARAAQEQKVRWLIFELCDALAFIWTGLNQKISKQIVLKKIQKKKICF